MLSVADQVLQILREIRDDHVKRKNVAEVNLERLEKLADKEHRKRRRNKKS